MPAEYPIRYSKIPKDQLQVTLGSIKNILRYYKICKDLTLKILIKKNIQNLVRFKSTFP